MVRTIKRQYFAGFTVVAAMALLCVMAGSSGASPGDTTRVSVDSSGAQADSGSYSSSISDDGRYVAFGSGASNLVPGDTNGTWDVFVRDLKPDPGQTETIQRVNVDSSGAQANGDSYITTATSISSDGRYVAFISHATNLVENDTNGISDVFVHDRQSGTTQRVNEWVSTDGFGNKVVIEANGGSDWALTSISDDGRYVAFDSDATNLVESDTNDAPDVFVRDLKPDPGQTETIQRVNVDSSGAQADGQSYSTSISSDGRYVAFASDANLVEYDGNSRYDAFVRDRQAGTTERVSENSPRDNGFDPSISSDGRYVAYISTVLGRDDRNYGNVYYYDRNDVFVYDRQAGTTERVSVGRCGRTEPNGDSFSASISSDGRYVTFATYATNLVEGDTFSEGWGVDVFVRDRQAQTTQAASVDSSGTLSNTWSDSPSISDDGRYVAFASEGDNLVAGDTNNNTDVFVHERQPYYDCSAPSTTASATTNGGAAYTSGTWSTKDVKVSLSAQDNEGGSGIKEIRYSATGADPISQQTVSAANLPATFIIDSEGTTTISYFATDNTGNQESPAKTLTVKLDKTLPKVDTVSPVNLTKNVARNTNVEATFTEKMNPASINGTTFKLFKCTSTTSTTCTTQLTDVAVTPGDRYVSNDGQRATLNPYGPSSTLLLASKTKYKAVVTTGVTDVAGHALDQDSSAVGNQEKVWYFTTGPK
jgi:Tol biopolymer transport system component